MDEETRREEQANMVSTIISLTKNGTLHWECVEYNPICAMTGDDPYEEMKPNPYICQMYTLEADYRDNHLSAEFCETITMRDNKGRIGCDLTVTNDRATGQKIEMDISRDSTYDELAADQLAAKYSEHPAVVFSDSVIKIVEGSDAAKETYAWARLIKETSFPRSAKCNQLTKLAEVLLNEHRVIDFHKCVLDTELRNKMIHSAVQ